MTDDACGLFTTTFQTNVHQYSCTELQTNVHQYSCTELQTNVHQYSCAELQTKDETSGTTVRKFYCFLIIMIPFNCKLSYSFIDLILHNSTMISSYFKSFRSSLQSRHLWVILYIPCAVVPTGCPNKPVNWVRILINYWNKSTPGGGNVMCVCLYQKSEC